MKFNLDEIRAKAEAKSDLVTWITVKLEEEYGWQNPETGEWESLLTAKEGSYGYELCKAFIEIAQNIK